MNKEKVLKVGHAFLNDAVELFELYQMAKGNNNKPGDVFAKLLFPNAYEVAVETRRQKFTAEDILGGEHEEPEMVTAEEDDDVIEQIEKNFDDIGKWLTPEAIEFMKVNTSRFGELEMQHSEIEKVLLDILGFDDMYTYTQAINMLVGIDITKLDEVDDEFDRLVKEKRENER